ncbi:ABC transporter permease [Dongia sp.]|uniref:ABC transporter permease n=1 Tax=Dongia sp. TaxID=1977262 RepID=UPI003750BC6F
MTDAATKSSAELPRSRASRIIPLLSRYAPLVCLVLLVIVFSLLTDGRFLKPLNLFNVMLQISIVGLIAVGMTFVILTAGIDLSVGSLVAVAGLTAALIAKGSAATSFSLDAAEAAGYGWFAAMMGAIAVGLLGGAIQGVSITKLKVPPFVVTLGGLSIFRGIALMISGSGPISGFDDAYRWWGQGRIGLDWAGLRVPIPVIIFLGIAAIAFVVLRYTRYGRQVYAVGGNREAARLAGVNVERVLLSVYLIIGFLSGLAGFVLSARLNSAEAVAGMGYELNVIAAVVIGGTSLFGGVGTILGTVIGSILIGVLNNGLVLMNVNPYVQQITIGLILVAVVAFDQFAKSRRLK